MPRARSFVLTFLLVSSTLAALVPAAESAGVTVETAKLDKAIVGASAAFVGGKSYIFGGRMADGTYSDKILGFDPVSQVVSTVQTLPVTLGGPTQGGSGRYSGTAVAFGGKIYYFGGAQLVEVDVNGDGRPEKVPKSSRDVIEFDPATSQVRRTNDALPIGAWGMASAVANGKIYLFGGFTFDVTDLPNTRRHTRVLSFDPTVPEPASPGSDARFKQMATPLPYAVQDAAAATVGRSIFIMGGLSDHDNATNPCPTYTYYNAQTGKEELKQTTVCLTKRIVTFTPDIEAVHGVSGELPYRAQFISAATVGGKAYVAGALLSDGSASASVVEVAADRAGTPQARVLVPALPRGAFGQAVSTDGQTIVLAGGRYGTDRELTDEIVRLDPRVTPPWAPRSATAVDIAGGVRLTWETPTYNGDGPITGYRIYRAGVDGEESVLADTPTLSYEDKTVRPGTEYVWRIVAINSAGESITSARVARSSGVSTPGPVSAFLAFGANGEVQLRWRAPTETGGSNITGYRIVRDGALLITLPPDASEYVDRTVTNGATYVYQVRAYNTKGDGALSDPERVTPAPVPPAPVNLVAEAINSGGESAVRITWSATDDVQRYLVHRSTRPGARGTVVANVSATTYVDNLVERGQTYYYTVVGENDVGRSPASMESAVSLVRKPGPPTDVLAFGQEGEIRVSWTPPEDTGDAPAGLLRYYVSRASGSGAASIIKTDLETTLFVDRLVTPGVTYTYTVSTINPTASDPSAPASASARAIQNKPPVAVLATNPPVADAGDPVEIDASNSADLDGTIRSYLFDFGDGTDPVTTDRSVVTHQFAVNGTYNTTVIVTDNRGDTSLAFAQVIVGEVVTDNPPESGIGGQPPGRENRPGSETPEIPGPAAPLVAAALAALALAMGRRRGHPPR